MDSSLPHQPKLRGTHICEHVRVHHCKLTCLFTTLIHSSCFISLTCLKRRLTRHHSYFFLENQNKGSIIALQWVNPNMFLLFFWSQTSMLRVNSETRPNKTHRHSSVHFWNYKQISLFERLQSYSSLSGFVCLNTGSTYQRSNLLILVFFLTFIYKRNETLPKRKLDLQNILQLILRFTPPFFFQSIHAHVT